ncbi:hypothetical protein, partial [Pseudomonas aeruginosa]|uniref:hypothetical protein n=1 Tax=Pseudomonas aeruginosa TaxID=287 RepID=UPI0015CCB656
ALRLAREHDSLIFEALIELERAQWLVQTGPRQVLRRQPRQGGGQLGRLGHGSALVLSKRLAGSLDRACPAAER